ncbi:hypothetical protein WJX72_002069 [[Myrmecia] bisecta]|uniref:UBR-type domain-containing protein n=1 Tax=[Myrmecia] bisecta TaxID=41462 RepID=A0AAW1Q6L6_9CHLO
MQDNAVGAGAPPDRLVQRVGRVLQGVAEARPDSLFANWALELPLTKARDALEALKPGLADVLAEALGWSEAPAWQQAAAALRMLSLLAEVQAPQDDQVTEWPAACAALAGLVAMPCACASQLQLAQDLLTRLGVVAGKSHAELLAGTASVTLSQSSAALRWLISKQGEVDQTMACTLLGTLLVPLKQWSLHTQHIDANLVTTLLDLLQRPDTQVQACVLQILLALAQGSPQGCQAVADALLESPTAHSPDDPSAEAPMPQMLDMLLALVIRSAAGLGLSGLRVLLTFPAVLVARLPDFLAQSEGAQQAAEMLPILSEESADDVVDIQAAQAAEEGRQLYEEDEMVFDDEDMTEAEEESLAAVAAGLRAEMDAAYQLLDDRLREAELQGTANPELRRAAGYAAALAAADAHARALDAGIAAAGSGGEARRSQAAPPTDASAARPNVCTFISSGEAFVEQHWYFCYTCGLVDSKGCCSVCAQVCHAGHDLVYSGKSRFFCDCGAGVPGCPQCKCLQPVQLPARQSEPVPAATPAVEEELSLPGDPFAMAWEWDPYDLDQQGRAFESLEESLPGQEGQDVFDQQSVLSAAAGLRPVLANLAGTQQAEQSSSVHHDSWPDLLSQATTAMTAAAQLLLTKLREADQHVGEGLAPAQAPTESPATVAVRSAGDGELVVLQQIVALSGLDPKPTGRGADRTNAAQREVADAVVAGVVRRSGLSCSQALGLLAVARGSNLALLDAAAAARQITAPAVEGEEPPTVSSLAVCSQQAARFDIVHVAFDSLRGRYLLVAGLHTLQVWTVDTGAKVTDRLPVPLPELPGMPSGVYADIIVKVELPDNQLIASSTVALAQLPGQNLTQFSEESAPPLVPGLTCILLSRDGQWAALESRSDETAGAVEAVTEVPLLPLSRQAVKGATLFAARLSDAAAAVLTVCHPASPHTSSKAACDALKQAISMQSSSRGHLEGAAGLLLPSSQHTLLVLLCGSGHLHLFTSALPEGAIVCNLPEPVDEHPATFNSSTAPQPPAAASVAEDGSSAAARLLMRRSSSSRRSSVHEALQIFEGSTCITSDTRLAGDVAQAGGGEGARQSLTEASRYLESASPAGMHLTIRNQHASLIIIGIRVRVGGSGSGHAPRDCTLAGQRFPFLAAGPSRWYSLPLTAALALQAHPEVQLQVGAACSPGLKSRIDSLEVYGRPLDQLSAPAQPAAAGAASAGSGSVSVGTAAVSLPGHLVSPAMSAVACEYMLSQALHTVRALVQHYLVAAAQVFSVAGDLKHLLAKNSSDDTTARFEASIDNAGLPAARQALASALAGRLLNKLAFPTFAALGRGAAPAMQLLSSLARSSLLHDSQQHLAGLVLSRLPDVLADHPNGGVDTPDALPQTSHEPTGFASRRWRAMLWLLLAQTARAATPGYGELLSCQASRDSACSSIEDSFKDVAPSAIAAYLENVPRCHAEAVVIVASSLQIVPGGEDWAQALCAAAMLEPLADVRKPIRELLLSACGGHTAYRDLKAKFLLGLALKDVRAAAERVQHDGLSYAAAADLLRALKLLYDTAGERSRCWLAWCRGEANLLPWLVRGALSWSPGAAKHVLALLNLLLPSTQDAISSRADKLSLDLDLSWLLPPLAHAGPASTAAAVPAPQQACLLGHFIAALVLGSPDKEMRQEACVVLAGLWRHACLGQRWGRSLPASNGGQAGGVVAEVMAALAAQNGVLSDHPHAQAYRTLQTLVQFSGYYLDPEGEAMPMQEPVFKALSLDNLEAETKYTADSITVRLNGRYLIKSFTLAVRDVKRVRSLRSLQLSYCSQPVAELSEVKSRPDSWRQAGTLHLRPGQSDIKQVFSVPVNVSCIRLHFTAFWQHLGDASTEVLHCPRCSHIVHDPHGVCRYCHENAYQCRHCRNINYESLDGFLCNECGHSRFGRFVHTVWAAASPAYPALAGEEDLQLALTALETETQTLQHKHAALAASSRTLMSAFTAWREQAALPEGTIPGPPGTARTSRPAGGNAYRCAELFTEEAVSLLGSMLAACPVPVARSLHAGGAVKELFLSNLKNGTPDALRQARQLLAGVAKHKPSAAHELLMLIRERVLYCVVQHQALDVGAAVRTEMLLLEALCSQSGADLSTWQAQLFLVFQLLLKASATRSPAVSEHIILRCLNILVAALGSSAPATASPPRTTTRTTHQANMDRAVDALEEDAGALVTMSGFQAGSAGMADYLERRNQLAARLASGKAQQRATRLALRMGRRWLRTTHQRRQGASNGMHTGGEGGGGGAGLLLESPQLLSALLLNESLGQVRELAVTLLQRLGLHSAHMRTRLAARLAGLLPDATLAGMTGGKLFDMLADLAGDATVAAYLGAQGVMSSLVGQIGLLVLKLLAAEHGMPVPADPRLAALFGVADASHSPAGSGSGNALGYSLKRLVDLLAHLLAAPQGRPRFQRAQLLGPSLLAVAGLGSLVVGRTTLTGEAESTLEQLLQQSWLAGDVESRRDALQAGMRTLRQVWECSDQNPLAGALLARIPAGLLDQMSWAIAPAPAETIYLLNLDKSASQEEFIRGAMTHNPYSTAEVGPLMRDVKNYICSHLDLAGLLDDDFGMELLVGGNIIALSLPVRLVFECVWMAGGGAGGAQTPAAAATPASRSELDVIGPPMPITYRLQGLDGEATEPMISQLQEPNAQALDPETDFAVADVLASPQLDALPLLLQQLFRKSHGPATSQTALLRLLHQATHLQVCRQQLLAHGGLQQLLEHAAATSDAPTDLKVDVSALAAGLKALLQHGLSACAEVLAHILPHLARHSAAAQAALLAHFARSLDLNALDAGAQLPQQQEQEYELQSFLRLAQSALVKGHQATAGCVAGQALLLPLLHQLEGVSGIDVKLGMAAEELLDGLVEAGGPQVASAIAALRTATRMRQKELADRRRQEMLASLGMQQVERAGGSQLLAVATPASSELARALEEVGEADSSSLTCMVCKEGYGAKPADLLAAYCYCKRVPTSQVPGFTQPANTTGQLHCTVSHFNLIHVSCHAAARRADANLRVPKTEWDGASLRNGTTLANNLLPVRGSRVSTSSYMAAVNTFFDNLSSSGRLARSRSSPPASPALDAARVSAVATDLALLLQRFAFGLSFSEDCHGGGKESNACILPYLLQMGRYLADNATTERLQGLMAYAEELAQWPPSNVAAAPPIPYFLALSLLLQSSSQWASVRRSALLNAVHFSLHGAPSSFVAMEVAIHELYAKCAPMMRFFGMVHKLHSLLQQPRSSSSDWVADMEARLLDVNIMTQSVDEFLEFVHDMEGATDAMELLDIIGVTEDALREHATCDTFLVSAMTLDASA